MEIRRFEVQDCELALKTVEALKVPDGYPASSADEIRALLSHRENVLIAASNGGGVPLGYVVGYLLERVDANRRMRIFTRSVSPSRIVVSHHI